MSLSSRPDVAAAGVAARPAPAHPAPERARASGPALWFGLFGGPAAWTVQTLVNLPVAAHACFPRLVPLATPASGDVGLVVTFTSAAAVLVCAAAMLVAWRSWSRTRHEHHTGSAAGGAHESALLETGEGRTRFMAFAGVLTSATFLLVALVHGATLLLVRPCGS